jgi:transposase
MNSFGETEQVKFLKGGTAYAAACKAILQKLQKSRDSMGRGTDPYENKKYWQKLKNISEHYAHCFSRQIIDYCREHQAKILVLPEYEEQHRRYVMLSTGNWSPIHLGTRIREKLKYKAWKEGIVVLELPQHHISDTCSICGARSRRQGTDYACTNGHRGNAYLNMAKNQGKHCLKGFGKQVP